jgi:hypothetical protein
MDSHESVYKVTAVAFDTSCAQSSENVPGVVDTRSVPYICNVSGIPPGTRDSRTIAPT